MDNPQAKSLSRQNKDELRATAVEEGVELWPDATNEAMIAAIQAARNARQETSQAEPTQPRPMDPETGRFLDEHGLPISGPARARVLAELGKPDPITDPQAWGQAPAGGDSTGQE